MELLDILLLLGLVAFGVLTAYQDYRHKIIKNKWVVAAILYAVVVVFGATIYNYYLGPGVNITYITEFLLNILCTTFAGIVIWYAGLWSAGDAKLFIAYAALVPLSVYRWGYVTHFPGFIILVNTFVPFFVYYLWKMVMHTSRKAKWEILKAMVEPKFLSSSLLFVFAFWWLITLALTYSRIFAEFTTNYFVLTAFLFAFLFLFKLLQVNLLILSAVVTVLRFLVDSKTIFTLHFAQQFAIIAILFIFIRYFVVHLGYLFFSKNIHIETLEPGMIPLENFVKHGQYYEKQKILPLDFIGGLLDTTEKNRVFHLISEGLSVDEVSNVQRLHSNGEIKDHSIRIGDTLSFAPFMLAGSIITLLCQGNLIVWLKLVIETFIML